MARVYNVPLHTHATHFVSQIRAHWPVASSPSLLLPTRPITRLAVAKVMLPRGLDHLHIPWVAEEAEEEDSGFASLAAVAVDAVDNAIASTGSQQQAPACLTSRQFRRYLA